MAEYPELNLQEIIPKLAHLAAGNSNPEIRCLAEVCRDLVFHLLNLEGEIEELEQRIITVPCDADNEDETEPTP